MFAYAACTIAFFAGLFGVGYFGQVCLSRLTNWNDRRRERALAYRARMRDRRLLSGRDLSRLDRLDGLTPHLTPRDLFGPIDINDLNRWRRSP